MSRSEKPRAVALKYDTEQDTAPVVVASGYGEIAQRIIDVAEKSGVPVYRDDSASSVLCMLKVGSTIPPELYEVIAVVYASLVKTSDCLRKQLAEHGVQQSATENSGKE